jgi:hypothetical protein
MSVGSVRLPSGCGADALEVGFHLDLLAYELEQQAVGELVGVARATQGLGVGADQAAYSVKRVIGDGGGVRGIGGQLEGAPSPLNSTTLVGSPVIAPFSSATRSASGGASVAVDLGQLRQLVVEQVEGRTC